MCFGYIYWLLSFPKHKNNIDITSLLSDSSDDDLYDLSD